MRFQAEVSSNPKKRIEVARRMFSQRFPQDEVSNSSLSELMGMEGKRVKLLYEQLAEKYKVGWSGRSYVPGHFELSDMSNKILTAANTALYGILTSAVYSMGYSPHLGFVHSGSPLPFVYDMADLYKEELCIDLAFHLTVEMCGLYNRHKVSEEFRKRVIDSKLLSRIGPDIKSVLGA
jgi:CRISPR-associated protein Cas1